MSATATISEIVDEFQRRTPTSAKLTTEARGIFPSGVTHDARFFEPHSIFVERASGSRKWDVDGHEYVDYFGGHGALLLGHEHPMVVGAIQRHLGNGTHFGSCHKHEIEWGQLVQRLVPSAERVRFTSSGTEATLLAMRLVRAWTGKTKIVRFLTHFHGWQDHVAFGVTSHHDGTPTPGVLPGIAENVILCPPNDVETTRRVLSENSDIAAVILEPTGATWGQVPTPPSFLEFLREETLRKDVLLVFDEVVTGFRCAPGGAQAAFGITPDMTTLAKILAGGLPGAAVAGRKDVMSLLDYQAAAEQGREKITHHGTFNANPLSSVAGAAALREIEPGEPCDRASDYAAALREELRRVVRDEQLDWCIYGTFSAFHIFCNPEHIEITPDEIEAGRFCHQKIKQGQGSPAAKALRMAMLVNGVDIMPWPGAPTSAVHTKEDLEKTVIAFKNSISMLKTAGLV